MPLYCYLCPSCQRRDSTIKPMRESTARHGCVCGMAMNRDLLAEHGSRRDAESPTLYSEALGVHPSQVAEARRKQPDIPLTDDGRVIITNYSERKRIAKKLGYHDKAAFC